MQSTLYAIQDILVGFHAPMTNANDEAMIRDFQVWQNQKDEIQARDLRLWKIGTYDDQTGLITPMTQPELLRGGLENGN